MSLLGKNPNESAFTGGRKHFTDVIKNTGPGQLLIWKQPEEDFNTSSTLIVMPGEQAIFVHDGIIEQIFDNGTYKLSTENYPFISRLKNAFSGGISTFNCVVYFVRNADSQEIKWGTDTPIQVRDKIWGIRTDAKVRAVYKVRVKNPAVFLEKLIGANIKFETQDGLNKYFTGEFTGTIKKVISKFLNNLEQELIGLDAYLDELSESIKPYIDEVLNDYGLKCVVFNLAGIDIDTTKYDSIDEAQITANSKIKIAQGDKAVMGILGEDWIKQQAVNIMESASNNPNGVVGIGAELGLGIAAGSTFGSVAKDIFSSTSSKIQDENKDNPIELLTELKKMLDAGLIEQAEYDEKKREILSRM